MPTTITTTTITTTTITTTTITTIRITTTTTEKPKVLKCFYNKKKKRKRKIHSFTHISTITHRQINEYTTYLGLVTYLCKEQVVLLSSLLSLSVFMRGVIKHNRYFSIFSKSISLFINNYLVPFKVTPLKYTLMPAFF